MRGNVPSSGTADRAGDFTFAVNETMDVHFYYGLGSRYSYIAATQIARIAAETSATFVWYPVFSGHLIKQAQHDPFAQENRRGQYEDAYRITDAQRWARYYSIPYREPDVEGVDWSRVIRACIAAKSLGAVERYSLGVYEDVFADANPPRSTERLVAIAAKVGLDAARFSSLLSSESVAQDEASILNQASRIGVFGVPTFVVGSELFWGQDRIPLLLQHLKEDG
jgi:2-hydroxychromene-2-carboxylate isomerase